MRFFREVRGEILDPGLEAMKNFMPVCPVVLQKNIFSYQTNAEPFQGNYFE
jgi:hypothetical protein